MATKHFFPTRDAELDEWLDAFIAKLSTVATQLGVTTQEVTDATALKDAFKQAVNEVKIKEAEKLQAVGVKDKSKKTLSDFIRPLVQRIKNHPNYSPQQYGSLLRIIGAEIVVDPGSLKPVLKVELDAGRPKIIWKKGPVAEGIKLLVDRNDGQGYRFLALDTKPDYIDTFPVPEDKDSVVWKYKGIYIIDDHEAGQESEVVAITVTKSEFFE